MLDRVLSLLVGYLMLILVFLVVGLLVVLLGR